MSSELLEAVARLTGPSRFAVINSSGTYDTLIVALLLDNNVVNDALPPGLSLLSDSQTPAGRHPVILTLGEQSNVHASHQSSELDYHEAIIGIPNVLVDTASRLPVIYLPRLDLDNVPAVLVGLFLGLPKKLSKIAVSANDFAVSTLLTGKMLERASWQATTDVKTPADFPNFGHVASLIQQPLLGVDAAGVFLYTAFQWHLDQATMQGVRAELGVPQNLPALPASHYVVPGFESQVFGTGRLRVPWNLSGPFLRRP